MKQIYLFLFFVFATALVNAQIINFPDPFFKAKLLEASPSNNIAQHVSGAFVSIDSNNNGEIEVSEAQVIAGINISSGYIEDFAGIENFINLEDLLLSFLQMSTLDLRALFNLETLRLYNNYYMQTLFISGLANLEGLEIVDNVSLLSLDLTNSGSSNFETLIVTNNDNLASIINLNGIPSLKNIDISGNIIDDINLQGLNSLEILKVRNNNLPEIDVSGLGMLTELWIDGNNISDLVGLSDLSNLLVLMVDGNSLNELVGLSELINITRLSINNNQFTELDISNLQQIETLELYGNNITIYTVDGFQHLEHLEFGRNNMTNINLDNLPALIHLRGSENQLSSLDLTGAPNIMKIWMPNNALVELDLRPLLNLRSLYVKNNQLRYLYLKNGDNIEDHLGVSNMFRLDDNPNLEFICTDNDEAEFVQSVIDNLGYTNCVVNTYCSFTPGGDFFTINGNIRYDFLNDGCDIDDIPSQFQNFTISNGANTEQISSNESGVFSFFVNEGTYTITADLENTLYFNVSPAEITVDFPADPNPFEQSFCITANGVRPDLQIEIIPISVARPGFEATYKIVYRNKGNQVMSGQIEFSYEESVSDFLNSIPESSSQMDNVLYYDYSNLLPFESGEINITMRTNSPFDNPPINNGDFLNYNTKIYPLTDDESPADNEFSLKQEVVGSMDPNDKTCLQGESVIPEMAGEYVHYLIRFENTGNYPAENIVVKDSIDIEKFDVSTLRALNSSHDFYSRIKENVVEFIFEDINLPFDDPNNDGYVLFKIKTNPDLQLGDTFSNDAAIYFDYNFPVITNDYVTTIDEQLGTPDFTFNDEFILYPNPSKNILNIQKKGTAEITSVEVYNLLGQVVIAIPSEITMVDVSSLNTGSYFLKINSDKGIAYSKFIKE